MNDDMIRINDCIGRAFATIYPGRDVTIDHNDDETIVVHVADAIDVRAVIDSDDDEYLRFHELEADLDDDDDDYAVTILVRID